MQIKKLTRWLALGGITLSSLVMQQAYAAGFQFYEQDAASLGDAHAGAVASDSDSASDNFYNPAGLVRLKSQQITTGAVAVDTSMRYKGTVEVNTLNPGSPQSVTSNGGIFTTVPNFHYALPINDRWAFGFSIDTPFGLSTDYHNTTYLRYAATQTSLRTIDLTPGFGYKVNHWFSVGAGVDAVYMQGTFDQYGALAVVSNDTTSDNSGHDWGSGYHAGMLFQFSQNDRLGLAYHSQVVNHMRGTSKFEGQLANGLNGGLQESTDLKGNITLPPYTTLSYFHAFNNQWAAMGSVQYTQWNVFNHLRLMNVASIDGNFDATNQSSIFVKENYSNAWNFAVGLHYSPVEKIMLKFGADLDKTPSKSPERNVQLPDQNRFMLNGGVHWQMLKKIGMDLGYSHIFFNKANINNVQPLGAEVVTTHGYSRNFANLYGIQFTWNF